MIIQVSIGCKSEKKQKKISVSKQTLVRIKKMLVAEPVLAEPNTAQFMTFYGQVTNNSKVFISKVQISLVMKAKKGEKMEVTKSLGEDAVSNLEPGETKSFNIQTSETSSDFSGYEIKIGKIEL